MAACTENLACHVFLEAALKAEDEPTTDAVEAAGSEASSLFGCYIEQCADSYGSGSSGSSGSARTSTAELVIYLYADCELVDLDEVATEANASLIRIGVPQEQIVSVTAECGSVVITIVLASETFASAITSAVEAKMIKVNVAGQELAASLTDETTTTTTTPTTTEYDVDALPDASSTTTTTTTPEPEYKSHQGNLRGRRIETLSPGRSCTDEEEFFLATDAGRYVLAGPPSEGWIITGDTKGWWERFLVRRCTRDAGGFFYLLKSRAHDRYLRADADGTISIVHDFAGAEEEFTLEEDIENGSSKPTYFRTWDGKYLTVLPNGGLLSVRKYYAQRFGLEQIPKDEPF
jgi:hypothetical protein